MKKILPILLIFVIMMLGFQVLVVFFVKSHEIEYSLINKDNSFQIEEIYKKNYYDFYVTDSKKKKYIFSTKLDFNKQKRVIKDIIYYENKELSCILPIYKRNNVGEISCIYQNEQVDYSYLDTKKIDTKDLLTKMKKYNYESDNTLKNNYQSKEYNLTTNSILNVYEKNVPEGYTFPIWNYNGIFFINKNKTVEKKYIEQDNYDNTNATIVGKYYIIFKFDDSTKLLSDLYYVNLEDYGKNSLFFKTGLDSNMYINGIYKNKLYLTDLKNKIEYSVDPYKNKLEVVGSEDSFTILKDDNLVSISKKDFFSKKYLFNEIKQEKITKKYGSVALQETDNYYYFLKDNVLYKISKKHLDVPVKLFEFNNITDWKVFDNDIIFVSDDTMYLYTDTLGIKPIVQNSEFKFNYKNICNIYKKL